MPSMEWSNGGTPATPIRCPGIALVYNIGSGNFAQSTVLKRLNITVTPDYLAAADALRMWNKVAGEVNPGLVRRREAERELFLS